MTDTDTVAFLLEKAEAAGLKPEDLDEAVHDAMSARASAINNDGLEGQLQFLVEECGASHVEEIINAAESDKEKGQCLARFQPQAWVDNHAIDIDDGAFEFDIAKQIDKMPANKALVIEDDKQASDELFYNWPGSIRCVHAGPFRVVCALAIRTYLQARGRLPKEPQ